MGATRHYHEQPGPHLSQSTGHAREHNTRTVHGNLHLILNTVCLPVLTYGCQLWYCQDGKGVLKFINMLQGVQNQMVKVVTGAFHTAPCKALLELMWMLPMRHHLAKLTHTSTLRLYRLPWASQLLHRLGPKWYVPSQGDHSLKVAHPPVPGRGNLCPTALEALTAWVPSNGPHVDVMAITPWEVPNWALCMGYMGTGQPDERKTWLRALWDQCLGSSIELSTPWEWLEGSTAQTP